MDRTEVNASPVQKALQGIKKYKYVLLTALLGVLLFLLPQRPKLHKSIHPRAGRLIASQQNGSSVLRQESHFLSVDPYEIEDFRHCGDTP